MKYYFVNLFLFLNIFETTKSIPEGDRVERIHPRGFRISADYDGVVAFVRITANINKGISPDFAALIEEPIDGRWVYDNINSPVKAGDTINYWITYFDIFGIVKHTKRQYVNTVLLSEHTIDISTKDASTACKTSEASCEISSTTVGRKPVCKGEVIFEDNFDILNSEIWSNEARIPPDEFVLFQNQSKNCYVHNGELHIIPSLLSEVPSFNESYIRTGNLLLLDCKPIEDVVRECTRVAKFAQILPPIVSAKIHTKNSFSFRYGRVVLRAKMPKGDWVFPLILLEPLENYYGYRGYASGQMRVAFMRGNEFLLDNNMEDISNKQIFGGLVVENLNILKHTDIKSYRLQQLMGGFHTFTLTWTADNLTLEIDGRIYGYIEDEFSPKSKFTRTKYLESGHKMAPFDREFYLSLGVSVGGHSDFPDGCRNGADQREKPWINGDPKAMLMFWKDRKNWIKTWNGGEAGLHIDSIKVYAL